MAEQLLPDDERVLAREAGTSGTGVTNRPIAGRNVGMMEFLRQLFQARQLKQQPPPTVPPTVTP